jgi:hypothetical protein
MQIFLDSECKNGFLSYARSKLSMPQQRELYLLQASYLSQEIDWLAQRYVPGHEFRLEIENILKAGPWHELPFAQIAAQARDVLREYVLEPDFDFELSAPQKERFLAGLIRAWEKDGFDLQALQALMPRLLPATVYDAATADALAETLSFKVAETDQQQRVEMIWKRLAVLFKIADLDLEKKVKSVLYDLTAETAILPPGASSLPAGRRLPVTRIDQAGYPLLMTKMDHFLFTSLLQSLLLSYVLTLVLMMLMRRSFSLGLISTLPIVFTSVVMFGLLALIGVPLDYATMMIGGVSIGVGIDYAIHFIHGYIGERDAGYPADEAIRRAFLDKGKAILTNALSVMAGFSVLLLSSLLPLRNFAWAMVCSMFLAALAALTLLPASLLYFNPKIKK